MKTKYIVFWLNLSTNEYYHKIYKTHFAHSIGYINQYNHKVVDIVEYKEIINRHKSLKRLIRKLISFLENILRNL